MAVQRSSVLKESSVWMCQLLVLVLCAGLVLMDTLGMHQSVMVSLILHHTKHDSNDGKNLYTDINECQTNTTLCDQICENTEGSFNCACLDGYRLTAGNDSQCQGQCLYATVRH